MSQLLRIPQPCAESWAAMTPTGAGRHCAACQKVVVDFTHKTDSELLAYLAGAKATPCGRFRADQLNRVLHPAAPVSRWRAWLASALALGGVLGAGRAMAQSRSNYAGPLPEADSPAAGTATTQVGRAAAPAAATPAASVRPTPGDPVTISGVVVDAETCEGLPGVTVLVKGTTTGTSTNAQGHFTLTLPAEADMVRLVVQSIGYYGQEVTLSAANRYTTLELSAQQMVLGGLVAGYEVRRPWPWHPRAIYHRTRGLVARLLNR